jgi:NADH-quinone oxidoreductase subunit L
MQDTTLILSLILFLPLVGCIIAGFLGKVIGPVATHRVTITLLGITFALSVYVFASVVKGTMPIYNHNFFAWALVDHLNFSIGFLVDRLTAVMLIVVTSVSLMVHIYSIGYMDGDPGYQRFFSYISGFTFAMLSLVMANNFLLLFFGWEGVGLVSYLLIGFWFTKETANFAALKAFIANRVGDLGFLLGVAAVLMYYGTLDYSSVFAATPALAAKHLTISLWPGTHWSVITVICLFLFVGAIGKSAQIPLHMWLEGSMEGPTPISALIHAATMVTAGVFMLARLSPMFECSTVSLSVVLIIGSATCFFMGILGTVQMDIKRVIAYSTLSQLGYMMAAQGASAFPIGMFHLMSHAAFKALLFLAAGSVIIAMHHKQDLGEMGGLRKFMPITYVCMLIGALALAAIPPFSGFFSKDLIIEAVQMSTIPGHKIASFFVWAGRLLRPFTPSVCSS